MMDDNKFFKWIWRINAIAIFLIVVGACVLISIEFIASQIRKANRTPPPLIENVADDPEGLEKWTLGRAMAINGTDLIMLPLESENKEFTKSNMNQFSSGYSSKSDYRYNSNLSKNILFINKETTESYWMFDNVERLIRTMLQFPVSYGTDDEITKALFFTVIINDSNKDGVIDYDDESSFAISSPQGKDFQIVLEDYDRIIDRSLMDNGNVLMLYQQNGIGYSMIFELSPFKLIENKALPKVTKQR